MIRAARYAHINLIAFSAVLTVLVAFAFWPGYFSRSPRAIDAYTHFHACVAALWLLLLIAQPALVAMRRLELHRNLGRASWALAPLFVLSSVLLAHFRFSRMDESTFAREAYSLYLPLSAALLFSLSFALAMAYRKTVQLHSRFIACTGLLLVDPVCGTSGRPATCNHPGRDSCSGGSLHVGHADGAG